MNIDAVMTRLRDEVPALSGRVKAALDLAELVRKDDLPQSSVSAFVLPLGLRPASQADASANAFTQLVNEMVGVLFIVRSAGDVTGAKAVPKIQDLIDACIAALCGWAPSNDNITGVMSLSRGSLLSVKDGTVMYQLDFSQPYQIRNLS
jgi:hypothetical protein